MASFTLRVNGERRTVAVEPDTPLLYAYALKRVLATAHRLLGRKVDVVKRA